LGKVKPRRIPCWNCGTAFTGRSRHNFLNLKYQTVGLIIKL
jgi:hypothetical protein